MAVIQAIDLADLVAGTVRELGRLKVQQIAQTLTRYEVFPIWFKKFKVAFDEGFGIQRNLMNRVIDSATHRGLMDADNVNLVDVIDQLRVDFVQCTASYPL